MFSKVSSKTTPPPSPSAPAPTPTPESPKPTARNSMPSIISADLTVTGDLSSDGDIQVDGVIEGDIRSRTVTIGEAAHVKGAIAADTVRVCGAVTGQV